MILMLRRSSLYTLAMVGCLMTATSACEIAVPTIPTSVVVKPQPVPVPAPERTTEQAPVAEPKTETTSKPEPTAESKTEAEPEPQTESPNTTVPADEPETQPASPPAPTPEPPAEPKCSDPVPGAPGDVPALTFNQRNWPLTGGLHMNTDGSINRNTGGVEGTTHIYNSYWALGYSGMVLVKLYNGCGDLIGVTPPHRYGVDAKGLFVKTNERTVAWSETIDPAIAARVNSAEVVHSRVTVDGDEFKSYRVVRDLACKYYEAQMQPCKLPEL